MQTQSAILAMAATARIEELKANDQELLADIDMTGAREFAAGVEAGLLWVLGHITAIPFPAVVHVGPTGNGPDGQVDDMLANLPGLEG